MSKEQLRHDIAQLFNRSSNIHSASRSETITEAMQLIDQYAYEYAERVIGPIHSDIAGDSEYYIGQEALRESQHKLNQELSPHRATKEGGDDE